MPVGRPLLCLTDDAAEILGMLDTYTDWGFCHIVWTYWLVWWTPDATGASRIYRIVQR